MSLQPAYADNFLEYVELLEHAALHQNNPPNSRTAVMPLNTRLDWVKANFKLPIARDGRLVNQMSTQDGCMLFHF